MRNWFSQGASGEALGERGAPKGQTHRWIQGEGVNGGQVPPPQSTLCAPKMVTLCCSSEGLIPPRDAKIGAPRKDLAPT